MNMFKRISQQQQQLKQINSQILGIKINLDLAEQNVSHGIAGVNALRSKIDMVLENLRVLRQEAKIVSIESVYRIKQDLTESKELLKRALAIYSNVRTERDSFKKHYDKALEFRERFVEENLTEAKVLIFKRKKDGQKSDPGRDTTENRE